MAADQLLAGIAPVFASNGEVVAGGSVAFYETGTATFVPIYADQGATIALENPFTLDAAGRAPQIFYTGSIPVRVVVKDAAGVQIDVIDPSPRFSVGSGAAAGITFVPIPSNPSENVQEAIALVSAALAAFSDAPIATVGGGTANAISLTSGKSLTSIPTGQRLSFITALNNTGAMTVAVDGLTAVDIKTTSGAATPADYVRAGILTTMIYDGAQWVADRARETVTNANGVAVKEADGTLTCTRGAFPLSTITLGGGSIASDWTFPVASPGRTPVIAVAGAGGGTSAVGSNAINGPFASATSGTQTTIFARVAAGTGTGFATGNTILADLTATGRWY